MVQGQIFFLEHDLLCVGDEGGDVFLDFFRVGRTEEYVLYLLTQFREVLRNDFSQCLQVSRFLEENVRLIDDDTLHFRQVEGGLTTFQGVIELTKGGNYNLLSFRLTRHRVVGNSNAGVLAEFLVHVCRLQAQFSHVADGQHLRLWDVSVDPQHGSDRKRARLA